MATCSTCTVVGEAGEVVINKKDLESYKEQGYSLVREGNSNEGDNVKTKKKTTSISGGKKTTPKKGV